MAFTLISHDPVDTATDQATNKVVTAVFGTDPWANLTVDVLTDWGAGYESRNFSIQENGTINPVDPLPTGWIATLTNLGGGQYRIQFNANGAGGWPDEQLFVFLTYIFSDIAFNPIGDPLQVSFDTIGPGAGAGSIDIQPTSLPNGANGLAYSEEINTPDGVAPCAWEVSAGALPNGLTLSVSTAVTVVLSGTPTVEGSFGFTIKCTDNNSAVGTRAYTVIIESLLTVTPSSAPDGEVGQPYEVTFSSDASEDVVWAIEGDLPDGLTFVDNGDGTATISGTPTEGGTFELHLLVEVIDGDGMGGLAFSIEISEAAAEPITVMRDGGYPITIRGLALPTGIYRVHVGPNGDDTDPTLYSGISGDADRISVADNLLTGVTPPLPIGGPYVFHLVKISGTDADATYTTPPTITVVPQDFRSGTFGIRGNFCQKARTGARRLRDERYPQE